MPESLRCVPTDSLIVGWDFSTGSVKAIAFDLAGQAVAEVRFPTDLWTEQGVSELSILQLEGQARASARALAAQLQEAGRLGHWLATGISATHHTSGRIDVLGNQVRRMICWNDQTLAKFHAEGLKRIGGQERARELTGGPWAERYSLSHLVKDERTLSRTEWNRTRWIQSHGSLAAGFLTGRFDCISVSSAASTGILDLRTEQWCQPMLGALLQPEHSEQAWNNLPQILKEHEPIGQLAEHVALDAGLPQGVRPLFFPTLDDQAAGLVGGGATEAGQLAIILGNSAVVNSSSEILPQSGNLDAMRLNWHRYLWMRCYSNGAQFLDQVVGFKPDWDALEAAAREVPAGCGGVRVLPFVLSEPSVGVKKPRFEWLGEEPQEPGVRVRASFEAIAYLIALGVREHEEAGQQVKRITVSGGIARSDLMCEILASALNKPIVRLVSDEGPALGAAVNALAGLENVMRKEKGIAEPFTIADAVATLVKFRDTVEPRSDWAKVYAGEVNHFAEAIRK